MLLYQGHTRELSGYEDNTTNNRMEIMACIQALEALKEPCTVDLYTDSAYVCNTFAQHWIDNWVRNGWKTASKKPVENQDLWKRMLELRNMHTVTFHKVKGHADNEMNNRCDKLATTAIRDHRG